MRQVFTLKKINYIKRRRILIEFYFVLFSIGKQIIKHFPNTQCPGDFSILIHWKLIISLSCFVFQVFQFGLQEILNLSQNLLWFDNKGLQLVCAFDFLTNFLQLDRDLFDVRSRWFNRATDELVEKFDIYLVSIPVRNLFSN